VLELIKEQQTVITSADQQLLALVESLERNPLIIKL